MPGGFIPGSRGSFMLDAVVVAMFVALPVLAYGLFESRAHRRFTSHRTVLLLLSAVLLVAVVAFELEMRLVGWRHLAEPSPYFATIVPWLLGVHVACSVTTTLLLGATVVLALRRFPRNPEPGEHSERHRLLGWAAAAGLALTSITGWSFYYAAFVA